MQKTDPFEVVARLLLGLILAGGVAFVGWLLWLVWLAPPALGPQ